MTLPKPTAYDLWLNYPSDSCSDGYENQCSIRLSIALEGAKVPLNLYSENKCSHGHARGAQGLANYLKAGWGAPTWTYRKNRAIAKQLLQTHSGVIFFKNCFIRQGETTKQGDHIDVWYGGKAQTYQNFTGSDEVWFWKLS